MIRLLQSEDVPLMLPLARNFFVEAQLPGVLKPEVFESNWRKFLASGIGVVIGLFHEATLCGVIGGLTVPDLCTGDTTTCETFWYVNQEQRRGGMSLRLLREFEVEAVKRGSKKVTLVHLAGENAEGLKKVYERLGFRALETHYVKEF